MRALLAAAAAALACTTAHAAGFWPKPASASVSSTLLKAAPGPGFFLATGVSNDVLAAGFSRYEAICALAALPSLPAAGALAPGAPTVRHVSVQVTSNASTLSPETDESYSIVVSASGSATITAATAFGALHALETLSQLLEYRPDLLPGGGFVIPVANVTDAPRFAHRGSMIDTARHFLPPAVIQAHIDALAYNKGNVLHWHLVDDQSFPFVSQTFPALSAKGAWGAGSPYPGVGAAHTYPPSTVAAMIQYGRERGVRVVPEFDTPGHTLSWGLSQPTFITQCYDSNGQPIPGSYGPVNPTLNSTWDFLRAFFSEVTTVFPDTFLHMGGDEVLFDCWASNPQIQAWMAAKGWSDYSLLENYYLQTLVDMLTGMNKTVIGWQEIFDNGLDLPAGTVVMAWKYHNEGGGGPLGTPTPRRRAQASPTWEEELFNITAAGFRAILTSPWYLNYIAYGATWDQYYINDPTSFGGTAAQKKLVLGGELCMWGEFVDAANSVSRTWPFGSAVMERLWSPEDTTDLTDAQTRMDAHRCRLLSRGIAAEVPNGPSYCPQEWQPSYNPPFALSPSA